MKNKRKKKRYNFWFIEKLLEIACTKTERPKSV